MKKSISKIITKHVVAVFFLAIVFANCILFFLTPKYTVDTIENKDKLVFPNLDSLTPSRFMKAYEAYFVNHFPYKYGYIKTYNYLKKDKLKSFTAYDNVIVGKNDWLFYNASIYDSLGMNEYVGYSRWSEPQFQKISSNIDAISKFCSKHNIHFELIICPSKQTIYNEFLPTYYHQQNENRLEQLYRRFPTMINLKNRLKKHKETHRHLLYYKTDTHWNLIAGAIAGSVLAERLSHKFPYINSLNNISIKDSAISHGFDLANMMALKKTMLILFYRVSFLDTVKQKIPNLIIVSDSFLESLYPSLEQLFQRISARHLYNDGIPSVEQLLAEKPEVFIIELTERYKELLTGNIDSEYFDSTKK